MSILFTAAGAGLGANWSPYPTGGNSAGWSPYPTGTLNAGLSPYPTGGHLSATSSPYPTGAPHSELSPYPTGSHNSAAPSISPSAGLPRPIHPSTAAPWPWQFLDPTWAYNNGQEPLMALALRKVQAKLVRPGDPRLTRKSPKSSAVSIRPDQADPLWRWASDFRIKAVVTALLARTAVDGLKVRHVSADRARFDEVLDLVPPDSPTFDYSAQVDKVVRAAVEREDRLPEILSQCNDFRPFFDAVTGLDRQAMPHLGELIELAWDWATHLVMLLKHKVHELRPVQRSALVIPVIPTPGHGSLPSGHATIAVLTADIFSALLYRSKGPKAEMLDRLARRIAFNRVVAGVHFQMDSAVGYELGRQLAGLFIALATGGKLRDARRIEVRPNSTLDETLSKVASPARGKDVQIIEPLVLMWQAAVSEIERVRV